MRKNYIRVFMEKEEIKKEEISISIEKIYESEEGYSLYFDAVKNFYIEDEGSFYKTIIAIVPCPAETGEEFFTIPVGYKEIELFTPKKIKSPRRAYRDSEYELNHTLGMMGYFPNDDVFYIWDKKSKNGVVIIDSYWIKFMSAIKTVMSQTYEKPEWEKGFKIDIKNKKIYLLSSSGEEIDNPVGLKKFLNDPMIRSIIPEEVVLDFWKIIEKTKLISKKDLGI